MKKIVFLAMSANLLLSGCARSKAAPTPAFQAVAMDSALTLVWSGKGTAYRHLDGLWARDTTYDYGFTVVQRRGEARWNSIKTLQRHHVDYDGRAGDRAQTWVFELGYRREHDSLASQVASSLGEGEGRSDREFRRQRFEIQASGVGRFSPFTHFRIVQNYRYEEGLLIETVELFKRKDGKETPFMRMDEHAYIYARSRLPEAPTRL